MYLMADTCAVAATVRPRKCQLSFVLHKGEDVGRGMVRAYALLFMKVCSMHAEGRCLHTSIMFPCVAYSCCIQRTHCAQVHIKGSDCLRANAEPQEIPLGPAVCHLYPRSRVSDPSRHSAAL